MNKRWFLISVLGLILLLAIVACAQSTPTADLEQLTNEEIEELIVERCSDCHPASRVLNADYDTEGWVDVFEDMINKGADVSAEEQEIMIDWLVNR